ncbi:MAG TPA: phosphoenolpyruvate--protein phosphotransferase, partial [Vicinamibacterales bacterium]|nr:phosphoenolpyruvate--protein phosphotransferase [Vicinamibacterales bacterium]
HMTRLTGRGVAAGIALGRAVVAVRDARQVRYRLAASGVDRERQRLRAARDRTRVELEEISSRVSRTVGPAQAAIFAAQLLMLDDPLLVRRADELIRTERLNGDWALERAIGELHAVFAREGDSWLRERISDLADVGGRLQRNLRPARDPLVDLVLELEAPLVLVADELPPSLAAQLDWTRIRGLVCDIGSPTHHTVILVRSLGVPAVVGLGGATQVISPGQTVALDGTTGEVVVEPADEAIERWRQKAEIAAAGVRALAELRDRPATTADGVRIRLEANLEIADEVSRVIDAGAEGIGLYRSEFLLDAAQPEAASEEAQVETYRALLSAMSPRPVTIRTFDAGEERSAITPRTTGHRDRFGLRGIRTAFHNDDRFRQQIRALLRSADAGSLRILLPFVTSGEELRLARQMIAQMRQALDVTVPIPVGAMIEVPAAALTVDHLARHADFLSVGTNDLIQYTLAIDRTDERLAGHYEPMAPAVLRLLRVVAGAGRRAGADLAVCGEMAADPLLVALLVGLGFRTFSMTPAAIPVVKRSLATLDAKLAARVARRALRAASADAVHALLEPVVEAMHKAAIGEIGT